MRDEYNAHYQGAIDTAVCNWTNPQDCINAGVSNEPTDVSPFTYLKCARVRAAQSQSDLVGQHSARMVTTVSTVSTISTISTISTM